VKDYESCDISGEEKLSIVLRYMKAGKVYESFTGFVEMDSVSAESISSNTLAHLSKIGMDFQKLAGQCCDGASTMAGHLSEVPLRSICALCFPLFKFGHQRPK